MRGRISRELFKLDCQLQAQIDELRLGLKNPYKIGLLLLAQEKLTSVYANAIQMVSDGSWGPIR